MKILTASCLVAIISLCLSGCNAGMAETGPTADQVKQKIDALPIDQQIAMIQNSPATAEEKKQRIDALKAKGGDANASATPTRPGSHP